MNEELTPQAREAVRAYLRYLFTVPGLIAVLLAGAGGFFFQDIVYKRAYDTAYNDALSQVQSHLITTTQEIAKAESEMQGLLKRMREQTKEGEELQKKWEDTTNFSLASEQVASFVAEIHKEVIKDPIFLENIDEAVRNPNVSSLNSRIHLECSWKLVGRKKSHYQDRGEWCPANQFITQLDLNLQDGAYVYSARCCSLMFK